MPVARREALDRARLLLRELLAEDEFKQYLRDGFLKVKSPSFPGREYHIPGLAGMVRVYEHGKPAMRLCVGPTRLLPPDDVVVTHLLMIRGDEQRYLSKANTFPFVERAFDGFICALPWTPPRLPE
jgi:hypothetical protein